MHRALVRLPAFAIRAIGAGKRASARPRLSHAVAAARQRRSLAPLASADAPDRRRPGFQCPACNQKCHRLPVLESHLLRCCPDLVPAGAGVPDWAARHAGEGRLAELLASIQERELAQRELAVSRRRPGRAALRCTCDWGGLAAAAAAALRSPAAARDLTPPLPLPVRSSTLPSGCGPPMARPSGRARPR